MFKRNRNHSHSQSSSYEAAQFSAIDPKTEAVSRLVEFRRQLLLDQIHPWAVEDRVQAQMACFAIAYTSDRTAEIMAPVAATLNEQGGVEKALRALPVQVVDFAASLSQRAHSHLSYADTLQADVAVDFTDENTREHFKMYNNLPDFPEYPYGHERDAPYGRSISNGTVEPVFIQGIIEAGKEIQATSYMLAGDLAQFPQEQPELYRSVDLLTWLRRDFIGAAVESSERAAQILGDGNRLSPEMLSDAYEQAYTGYVNGALGYVALHCPAVLGEDYVLDRTTDI